MDDVSFFVFHVDFDLAMRIGPDEIGDGSLQSDGVFLVIRGSSVVGESGCTNAQEADRENEMCQWLLEHAELHGCLS